MSRLRRRVRDDFARVKRLLSRAFSEDHTSEEVARSFGVGVFITMLPTLGIGFVAFLFLSTAFERLSKLALVASAVVFNPVVKWGVYALSFGLGSLLLGPVEGVSVTSPSLDAAPPVVVRLVVGNAILAVAAAVPSYYLAQWFLARVNDTIGSLPLTADAPVGSRLARDLGVDDEAADVPAVGESDE